jgi:hypothetical protein
MQQFVSKEELSRLKVTCSQDAYNDVVTICSKLSEFKNVNVIKSNTVTHNLVNDVKFVDHAIKKPLTYRNCKICLANLDTIPSLTNKKYIYLEDYKGDHDLVKLTEFAKSQDAVIYSNHSLKKAVTNTIIDKKKYDILETIGILKQAWGYIGYDYSNFAPIAYKYRRRINLCVLRTDTMINEEVILKFYPAENLDFMYNSITDFISAIKNEKNKEVNQ